MVGLLRHKPHFSEEQNFAAAFVPFEISKAAFLLPGGALKCFEGDLRDNCGVLCGDTDCSQSARYLRSPRLNLGGIVRQVGRRRAKHWMSNYFFPLALRSRSVNHEISPQEFSQLLVRRP